MFECVPTPYSIMNPDEGEGTDVFASIIPDSDDYSSGKRSILWAVYGDTGIGNPDSEYWIRRMKGRYAEIKNTYDLRIKAFEEMKAKIAANGISTDDTSQTTRTEQYGKTTVTDGYGKDGELTVTNDLKSANYDPAQDDTTDAEKYLSDFTKDTGSVTTKDTRTRTTSTEIGKGADGEAAGSKVSVSGGSGLETETIKKWMESVEDPYQSFAKEFAKYFYWGL